jgi:hypothetical protein
MAMVLSGHDSTSIGLIQCAIKVSTGVTQIAVTTLLPSHSSSTLLSHLTLLDQTKGIWVSGLQLRSFNLAQLDHR